MKKIVCIIVLFAGFFVGTNTNVLAAEVWTRQALSAGLLDPAEIIYRAVSGEEIVCSIKVRSYEIEVRASDPTWMGGTHTHVISSAHIHNDGTTKQQLWFKEDGLVYPARKTDQVYDVFAQRCIPLFNKELPAELQGVILKAFGAER